MQTHTLTPAHLTLITLCGGTIKLWENEALDHLAPV